MIRPGDIVVPRNSWNESQSALVLGVITHEINQDKTVVIVLTHKGHVEKWWHDWLVRAV